ncbi:MAG: WD40/YVTN/BNR-like repeat-containing protein, partial [Thermoanaerobaculia bacterium]
MLRRSIFFLLFSTSLFAAAPPTRTFNADQFKGMQWREVGPYRGGRSAAVEGITAQPNTYYFGSTGGGVWKTIDGGQTWKAVSDTFFGGSIGAVAVSEWDPNVVYAGGGEATVRGNVSHGDGMWKSTDAGKTWTHIGLTNSRHIPRIRIHP